MDKNTPDDITRRDAPFDLKHLHFTMRIQIEEAAFKMRHLLEGIRSSPKFSVKGTLAHFPYGCCEYASLYLARYLIREKLCLEADIKVPRPNIFNDKGETHAWLRIKDRWHVDITADQFGRNLPKLVVAENSDFHDGFKPMSWKSFEDADYFVFQLLGGGVNGRAIGQTWLELQDLLPQISNDQK